jgi:hypothetical protein
MGFKWRSRLLLLYSYRFITASASFSKRNKTLLRTVVLSVGFNFYLPPGWLGRKDEAGAYWQSEVV